MAGEKNLDTLLATMTPELMDEEYVFCTVPDGHYGERPELEPVATIRESEGLTLVIPRRNADKHRLGDETVFRQITLSIHSSLDAIGLTAAFSNKLTEHGISANVLAGYYHDHIFVPAKTAKKAMQALEEFSHQD